ncbi:hypothetical protein ADIS_4073 [Lunatimonas lonarensis]|uniref:DinB-like domain-containing protein n=1 Tax=Lunatimonas lonarensis TaxID=1232681 RepID=R7ZMX3_9BACT|nr:DinB family protein [Lunatimonas lonarensis]EON75369.1 hypothetical protein ADIS_4073 [Lunatimonas lonarensis]
MIQNKSTPATLEVWQRGPIEGVPSLLQPVAHALLQTVDDVARFLHGFEVEKLWIRPAGMASVGFHLQHMAGVVDRLFTYADGQPLNGDQLAFLKQEGIPRPGLETVEDHIRYLERQIGYAIDRLRTTDHTTLTETRLLGRQKIPTTQLGLLFHAAEHLQRHVGQLLVTVKWVQLVN